VKVTESIIDEGEPDEERLVVVQQAAIGPDVPASSALFTTCFTAREVLP
jgi:hypothetical protein